MDAEQLRTHWALALAFVIALVVVALAIRHFFDKSARGQLRRMRKSLDIERGRYRKASAVLLKAERQRTRLLQHADKVKPRLLREANEALEDTRALAKIAADRVMVAENHLRRVILEEFPPAQHDRLKSRYLPEKAADKKPFTF